MVVVVVVVVVSRRRSGRHRTTGLGGSTAVSTTETAYPPMQSWSCGGLSHGDDEENYRALFRRRRQFLMPGQIHSEGHHDQGPVCCNGPVPNW